MKHVYLGLLVAIAVPAPFGAMAGDRSDGSSISGDLTGDEAAAEAMYRSRKFDYLECTEKKGRNALDIGWVALDIPRDLKAKAEMKITENSGKRTRTKATIIVGSDGDLHLIPDNGKIHYLLPKLASKASPNGRRDLKLHSVYGGVAADMDCSERSVGQD